MRNVDKGAHVDEEYAPKGPMVIRDAAEGAHSDEVYTTKGPNVIRYARQRGP